MVITDYFFFHKDIRLSDGKSHRFPLVYLLGFEEEIIERIDVDVDRRGSRRHEAGPLPSVVFGVEQKVCAYDCHAHGHDDQNQEHQQHETVHVVDLVRPERGEDEVPETNE